MIIIVVCVVTWALDAPAATYHHSFFQDVIQWLPEEFHKVGDV